MKKTWHKLGGFQQHWGIYIGENHNIYRDIDETLTITAPQISQMQVFEHNNTSATKRLRIWYRKVGKRTVQSLDISYDYGRDRVEVIDALLNGMNTTS